MALVILYFILVSGHSVRTIAMCSVPNRYLFLHFSVQSGLYIAFSLVQSLTGYHEMNTIPRFGLWAKFVISNF